MREDEDFRTIFCANLHEKLTETLLYELFLQAGPIERVTIPKDKDGRQRNFGFVTYCHSISVPYAINIFEGTKLLNREISIRHRNPNSNNNIKNNNMNYNNQQNNTIQLNQQIQQLSQQRQFHSGNNNNMNNHNNNNYNINPLSVGYVKLIQNGNNSMNSSNNMMPAVKYDNNNINQSKSIDYNRLFQMSTNFLLTNDSNNKSSISNSNKNNNSDDRRSKINPNSPQPSTMQKSIIKIDNDNKSSLAHNKKPYDYESRRSKSPVHISTYHKNSHRKDTKRNRTSRFI